VRSEWQAYQDGMSDNSFYIWQWISIGMMVAVMPRYHSLKYNFPGK
jgi:hypothetical protein